jgi:hypothetical protein
MICLKHFRTLFVALAQPFVSDVGKENAPVYFAPVSSLVPRGA